MGEYKVNGQYISAEDMIKLIEIKISSQEPESFEEVEKDLKNIRQWGGADSISKEMEKVFEREL